MSVKRNMARCVMVFSLVLISEIPAKADEDRNQAGQARTGRHMARDTAVPSSSSAEDIASQLANLPRSAPIGHRQPRGADVRIDAQPAPNDVLLQRENSEIDRKLVICRRC
jgi:hypothetical protein